MLATALLACSYEQPFYVEKPDYPDPSPGTLSEPLTVDSFVVDPPSEVDALVVVDPALQADALAALPALLDHGVGTGASWRVGLASTALGGPSPGSVVWVDLSDPDPLAVLSGTTLDDQAPLGALGATWLALQGGADPQFRRPDAALVVLAAEADDDATPASILDEAAWRSWFAGLGDATFDAAVPIGAAPVLEGLAADFGAGASDLEAGLAGPLDQVGRAAVAPDFHLSAIPREIVSVSVSVPDGPALAFDAADTSWDPVENAVRFVQFVPDGGSTVEISYYAQ